MLLSQHTQKFRQDAFARISHPKWDDNSLLASLLSASSVTTHIFIFYVHILSIVYFFYYAVLLKPSYG